MTATATAAAKTATGIEAIYDNYVETFGTKQPDAIIKNHAENGTFWLHTGGAPVQGREAIARTFAGFFANWPEFGFKVARVIFAQDHWVLDWAITAVLTGKDGTRHPVSIDALDIIDVDADGLVSRKDTWIDGGQLKAALEKLA
jgi:uncharacterized protein (TIGR02246 family)